MTKTELKKFKEILQAYRDKIAHGLHHLEEGTLKQSQRDSSGDLSGYSFHMADMASDNFETEFNLGLAASEQQVLNKIDAALKKIEEGTFGMCEGCEKKINIKRLTAMPYAAMCIECQSAEEQKSKSA